MIELRNNRAYWRGTRIGLSKAELMVITSLVAQADVQNNTDLTYLQIHNVMHGEGFISGHGEDGFKVNVRGVIKRIRNKFRDVDPEFDRIKNYPRFGYYWSKDLGEN